jgi:hypothetical protein
VKYLYLAFLIGLSGSAYAATGTSPPDDIPITITGAAPPAQAVAAGFTTPVISSDFTSSAYANTSTWLDCAGASRPIWFQGNGAPAPSVPCPDITTDGGVQVLRVHETPTASSSNGIMSGKGNTAGILFPATSFYMEGVMRWTPNQAHAFANAPWVGYFQGCSLEFDSFENTGPGIFADSASHNCGPGIGAAWPGTAPPNYPGFDITQYHTYGARVNTDASTGIKWCAWIDDRLQGCQSTITAGQAGVTTAQITTTPGTVNLFTGLSTDGTSVASNFDQYIKRITVWSCSNWQSSNQVACKTSTLDPGGY